MTGGTTRDDARPRQDEIADLAVLEPGEAAPELQALLDLAVQVCGVSAGALNIITDDAQHQVATVGVERSVCDREDSMCALVLDQPTLSVGDAREDPRFDGNPFVDGRVADVRFYASAPLRSTNGVTIGRLCVFDEEPNWLTGEQEDVLSTLADRLMDVLELRRRTRQLEEANRRLSLFAAQVSHDLRSPLAAMLLYVELAAEQPEVARGTLVHNLLGKTVTVTRRMTGLVEGMLRGALSDRPLQVRDVDLRELYDAVVVDLGAVIDGSGARVTAGELDTVPADAEQLYSVMLNLLSNALKFTRGGVPARVHVSSRREGDRVVLEVRDEGRGVPPEEREQVFEHLDRGADTADAADTAGTAATVDGHGIGLATVRRLVDAHGGTVTLLGNEPHGTIVRVTLPA